MLGRRSDVYSSSARFVSSIACKRQTSSHRHVEEKEEDEMEREERWYLPHKFQARSMAEEGEEEKEMVWNRPRQARKMLGKRIDHSCWVVHIPRALAIDVMTCYSSRHAFIHAHHQTLTHTTFILCIARPPNRRIITLFLFEPLPRLLHDRFDPKSPEEHAFLDPSWRTVSNCCLH